MTVIAFLNVQPSKRENINLLFLFVLNGIGYPYRELLLPQICGVICREVYIVVQC